MCKHKTRKNYIEKYGKKYQVETENFKVKSKKTKIEKYNDENFTNRDKYVQTCIERYDVINTFQSEKTKEKSKITKKEKYNNENFTNFNKMKNTKKERYDDSNYNNHEKYIKTCLEKYNVETTFLLISKEDICRNTKEWFKNNPNEIEKRRIWMASDDFKQKSIDTCLEKYGVRHNMHVDSIVFKNQISGYFLKKIQRHKIVL